MPPHCSALVSCLRRFYSDRARADLLASVTEGRAAASLRLVEWYVTSGAPRGALQDYQAQLRAYTRRMFDPFRRSDRVVLDYGDRRFETTIGQMNFFKWMIEEGHWSVIVRDRDALTERMTLEARCRRARPKAAPARAPAAAPGELIGPRPQLGRSTTVSFE